MEEVVELKESGNEAFNHENWIRAKELYTEAIKAAENAQIDKVLLSTLWSNRSATFAALEDYESALHDAEETIKIQANWPRGYARKVVALVGLNQIQEAQVIVENGLKIDLEDQMLLKLKHYLHEEPNDYSHLKRKSTEGSSLLEALNLITKAGVEQQLPVVVIAGFLGSGKTTLLNRILADQSAQKRIAVLVNDMAEINIDAEMVRSTHEISESAEELIELTNGCVCCTLREDLIKEATRIICAKKFDLMVIESTGISEPMPVAATFTSADFHGASLKEFFQIDNMVTVVDCSSFIEELEKGETLKEKHLESTKDDDRDVSHLLMDQVEFANTILLNKSDLVSDDHFRQLKELVSKINPQAQIFKTIRSVISLGEILNTKRFNIDWAESIDGFNEELVNPHISETLEYGISSTVFKSQVPFHPVRLHEFFFGSHNHALNENHIAESSPLQSIYRSKGIFYLANNMEAKLSWSTAGRNAEFLQMEYWLASMFPSRLWTTIEPSWSSIWGDREQKIVLIGKAVHLQSVLSTLERCLLTTKEQSLDQEQWTSLDPHNLWKMGQDL